jgi:hypothetical protein
VVGLVLLKVSERVAPGFVLFGGDFSTLAKIISKVIPILTGVNYITTHNSLMLIAEDVECLLLSHESEELGWKV